MQVPRSRPKDGQESMYLCFVRLLVFCFFIRQCLSVKSKRETIDIAHTVRGFLSVRVLGHPA
jgi:hypothetical protein